MGWVHGGGTAVGMLAEMLAGGIECQSRRPRSCSDRGRASDHRMDADDARLSAGRERCVRHGNLDGEPDGGVGGAHGSARTGARQHGVGGEGALLDSLYVEGRAWMRFEGDGSRGLRHRCVAKHAGRSFASRRCGSDARADQARSRDRLEAFPGGRLGRYG